MEPFSCIFVVDYFAKEDHFRRHKYFIYATVRQNHIALPLFSSNMTKKTNFVQ